jgi:hypothetical protein
LFCFYKFKELHFVLPLYPLVLRGQWLTEIFNTLPYFDLTNNIRKDCIVFQNNVRLWKMFKLGNKYWEETTLICETTQVYGDSYLIQWALKENCHSKIVG